jgi:hypothetical protein
MNIRFTDLWRPSGTIGRASYAVVGLVGFALKHNLDRFVAFYGFHRRWGLFNYWVPVRDVARLTDLRSREAAFLETMLVLALPFIWVGVVLTMKRLRSAGLPSSLVALFFIPFLNLLFFLVLCVVPERDTQPSGQKTEWARQSFLTQIVPESALGSAAISLLITVPLGLGMVLLGIRILTNYGWGLFVALPFTIGFAAALIYGIRQPRSFGGCVGVACVATMLLGVGLLALALEGIVCLIMAMPIALPLAIVGAVCAYPVQRRRWLQEGTPAFLSVLLIVVPGVQWTEHVVAQRPSNLVVHSAIDVHAAPEEVWQQVIAFTEIPPPTEWLFHVGIAYPIRAEMLGSGPGAERHCIFSTGAFIEPIEVWDAPHRLKFSVTENPAPMQEWTPYSHIEPAHLHGFLVSTGGQFLLTPLPNGWTRLEGTTWYRHGLWPSAYWQLWSDAIIHRIHLRVLKHIREEAEKKVGVNAGF